MGPALIPQDLRFLVVYVFSAQGLPGFSAVGVPAINALVQVLSPNQCLSISCSSICRITSLRDESPHHKHRTRREI